MATAIYFHPEGYTTSGPRLMGRHAAGESFLRGFLAHSAPGDLWLQVEHREHVGPFMEAARAMGRDEPIHVVGRENLEKLSEVGTVYYPGPALGQYAWQRSCFGHGNWSLCGITHTTSSAGAMDHIADLAVAPVQLWDALICTSRAVKDNVDRILDAQHDHLARRLGATRRVAPLMPIIPLGIHSRDFAYTDEEKSAARKALGTDSNTHVVMFMGRLAFHAKAHPLAMYQALERAAAALPAGESILLVECGWFPNENVAEAYRQAAAAACPRVRVNHLDGRNPEQRKTAWAGADVFCSLSDNIQETFGIVPIEAMAAGLPLVVSDWDGYRDTVRHGIDGFRIPTIMPAAGLGRDLARRHALGIDSYDMYCGYSSSLVAVAVDVAEKAFSRLFASRELRLGMGEEGRKRAREVYDWSVIMGQYEALWERQTEIRLAGASDLEPAASPWPARLDPFHGFAGYPTKKLTHETLLTLSGERETALARAREYRRLTMVDYADYVLPNEWEMEAIIDRLSEGSRAAGELVEAHDDRVSIRQLRSLVWMVKAGILRVA